MSFIPGANIGPYRIVEQAERNGVATTYTAYQPSLGRYVNLVVVPAIDRDDVSLQRQYQRQLDLILTLRHPNIQTVIDKGEHLDVPFVVTETIEAEPLSDRLGAPWPLAEVVRVLRPIAAALDYAHGLGVVHGDIRSSSVLLTPDGTAILAGFGLMTRPLAVAAGSVSEPGRRASSPLEEIAQAQAADRRGLALIAYEMLTGRTTDVEANDFGRPLLPAQIGSPLLAGPVERVLLRELTGEATDRCPTATAFVDELSTPVETTRTNGVTPAPPTTPTAPAATPRPAGTDSAGQNSRRRLITVALIFAALALLGALAILLRGGDAARPIASPGRTPGAEGTTGATSVVSTPSTGAPAAGAPSSGGPSAAAPASGAPSTGAIADGASAGAPAASGPGVAASAAGPPTSGAATGAAPQPKAPSAASAAGQAPGPAATPNVTAGTILTPRPAPTISLIIPTLPPTLDTSAGAAPSGASATGAPAAAVPPSGAPSSGAPPAPAPTPRQATPAPASAGTTRLPVTWRVVGDPSGRWMLDDQSRVAGRTETGASVVLFPETVDDVNFSASLNTTSCQATLVFRAQDDENLLMAIYIPDGIPAPGTAGGGVWLYQRVEGLDLPIRAVRPSTVRPAGEPARLKIVTNGPSINVFLNDEPALQAVDTAPRSGRLGLMVYSASGRLCEATFGDIQR